MTKDPPMAAGLSRTGKALFALLGFLVIAYIVNVSVLASASSLFIPNAEPAYPRWLELAPVNLSSYRQMWTEVQTASSDAPRESYGIKGNELFQVLVDMPPNDRATQFAGHRWRFGTGSVLSYDAKEGYVPGLHRGTRTRITMFTDDELVEGVYRVPDEVLFYYTHGPAISAMNHDAGFGVSGQVAILDLASDSAKVSVDCIVLLHDVRSAKAAPKQTHIKSAFSFELSRQEAE